MEITIAQSIVLYAEKLYDTNKILVMLSGVNYSNMDAGINELLDLLHSIPQLIPYKYDKKKKI